jgi:hypothetical protein
MKRNSIVPIVKCSSIVPIVKSCLQKYLPAFVILLRGPQNYILIATLLSACSQRPQPAFSKPERLPDVQLAQETEVSVPFGQPVQLDLRITTETPLEALEPESWLEPGITLLNESVAQEQTDTGWRQDISLSVAMYAVTNTPVFVSTPVVETPEIRLPFVTLETTSRLTDTEGLPTFGTGEPPDFRGPEALRRRNRNLWIGGGVLLLLAVLIGLLARYFAKRERPVPPPTPAHVIALRNLEALKQQDIWIQQDLDAATVALSDILRAYIENRFSIQAPDLTTEEFLLQVEADAPWPEAQQSGLAAFFNAADRIKFAGARPGTGILDDLYGSVLDFVNTTKEQAA